jgi:hypothetical protein
LAWILLLFDDLVFIIEVQYRGHQMLMQMLGKKRLPGRGLPLLVVALLAFTWLAGCAGSEAGASLGEPFTLALGQGASIEGEGLSVRFAEVIGDSRCPQGATCIWAGEVSCRLEITHDDVTDDKVLVQPGATEPPRADYGDYAITFDVQPYPKLGEQIKRSDYRLTMTFSKKPG